MTLGVGLVVGEVPKLIFRARKIPIVFLQPPWFFRKMTPGVGLVFGEVPKLIFRARKITFRRTFLLYSFNCHDSWSGFGGWRGPKTYFQG